MKKPMNIMVISLSVVFGGIIAFNLAKSLLIKRFFAQFEFPPMSVSTTKAQAVNWQPKISAIGNFVASSGVDVNSEASGNVMQIHFESGQFVEKDAPLITIDDRIDQAQLKFSQSEHTLKELNYKRQADLFKKGATSISSVDEAKANLQQAEAKVEQIQAQINQKHINAPFSGKLGIRQVNIGQFVSPGQTSIVSLQSLDPLFIEFYLPEQDLKKIKTKQNILFSIDEYPNYLFEGYISAINSKVDMTSHNVLIQATLANCPHEAMKNPLKSSLVKTKKDMNSKKLIISCVTENNQKNKIQEFTFIPGLFSSIEIGLTAKPNTIVVPSTAVSFSLYGNSVYLIEKGSNKRGKDTLVAKRIFVKTGDQEGNYTVVKKGLKAGQEIVSTGDIKLQNGTPVEVNNEVTLNEKLDLRTLKE